MTRTGQLFYLCGFLLLGVASQLIQTLQIREMLVVFYGNELSLGLFFAAWLFWIAVGSRLFLLVDRRCGSEQWRRPAFVCTLLGTVPACAVQLLATYVCRRYLDTPAGEVIPFGQWVLAAWLLTMPSSILLGFGFPLGISAWGVEARRGDDPGVASWLYMAEAVGSLLAGLVITWLLVAQVSHVRLLILFTTVILCFAAVAGRGLVRVARVPVAALLCLVGAAWALATWHSDRPELLSNWLEDLRWQTIFPRLERLDSLQTPYQHISVARLGQQISLVHNGMISVSFPQRFEAHQTAALILSQWAEPTTPPRILFFGSPLDPVATALLEHPIAAFTGVTADPAAWDRLAARFPDHFNAYRGDPRVSWRVQDGRQFINRLAAAGPMPPEQQFDVVVLAVGDPATAALNRYFTREAFAGLAGAMSEGAVLTVAVTSASNYLGREVRSHSASVYWTLREAFADVQIVPGDEHRFFAAAAPGYLSLSPRVLRRRYLMMPMDDRVFPAEGFFNILPAERIDFLKRQLREAPKALNTDQHPITYYANMLLWGRFTGSSVTRLLADVKRLGIAVFVLPFALFVVFRFAYDFCRRSGRGETRVEQDNPALAVAIGFSVAVLGLTAMTVQILLLYAYQNMLGYVYERIAQLNGLAMLGLALGAAAGRVSIRVLWPRARPGWPFLVLLLSGALVAVGLLPFGLGRLSGMPETGQHVGLCAAMVMMSLFTGMGFPVAFACYAGRSPGLGRSSAHYEVADHLGAAAGALLAGAVWMPLFGVAMTRVIVMAALFASILLLAASRCTFRYPAQRFRDSRLYRSFPYLGVSFALAGVAVTCWLLMRLYSATPRDAQSGASLLAELGQGTTLSEITGDARFEEREEPFPHIVGYNDADQVSSYTFSSLAVAPDVIGYAGPIDLLVVVDADRDGGPAIQHLSHRRSNETPSYIYYIDRWLGGFVNAPVTRDLTLFRDVDAMTGATITSRAVVKIVNQAMGAVRQDLLKLQQEAPTEPSLAATWLHRLGQKRVLGPIALLLLFFPVYLSGRPGLRRVYQLAVLLAFGVAWNMLFTLIDVGSIASSRFPDVSVNLGWYIITGFILVTGVLWGQVYCGFVCPFGALQEWIWELGRRLGLRRYPSVAVSRRLRYVKYILLSTTLSLFFLSGRITWITYNPMQYVFSRAAMPRFILALTIAVGVGALVFYRFWCRYFCPAGAFLSLFNKVALWRRGAPRREIPACDLGVRAEFDVDCLQCNRCIFRRQRREARAAAVGSEEADA